MLVARTSRPGRGSPDRKLCPLQTVCLALTLPLAIGLAMLLGWNLYLALTNKTTIEFYEGVTASIQVCHASHPGLLYAVYTSPPELLACMRPHGGGLRRECPVCTCADKGTVRLPLQAGRAGAAAYQHPYDLGLCGNLHALCGHSPTTWLVPTLAAAHGDGLAYPTTYDRAHDDIFGL